MAKCKVCGSKIVAGQDACPLCGTQIENKVTNNNSGTISIETDKTIFTIANMDFDLFDVIAIVVLGVFSLVTIVGMLTSLFNTYYIFRTLISCLQSLLYCLSFWGLFIYHKTQEKIVKLVDGIFIIVSTFLLFILNIIAMVDGYSTLGNMLTSLIGTMAPVILAYILIVLKNKDEKENIKIKL